jgi:hypothetical protein
MLLRNSLDRLSVPVKRVEMGAGVGFKFSIIDFPCEQHIWNLGFILLDPDARSSNHINAPQKIHAISILPLSLRWVGIVSGFRPRYCKVERGLVSSATVSTDLVMGLI